MIIVDQIKEQLNVMMHPSSIKSKDVMGALAYYYKISIVPVIILLLLTTVFASSITSAFSSIPGLSFLAGIGIVVVYALILLLAWVLEPIGLLIGAGILQVIGGNLFKVFKGRYNDTLTVFVYGASAGALFVWLTVIPIIGSLISLVISLWALIIYIVGLATVHKTSRLAAFGIIVVAWIIVGILFAIVAVILGSLFALGAYSSPSLMGSTCIASPGYLCSGLAYSHLGSLALTLGQSTGGSWTGWGVAYAPAGTMFLNGTPDVNFVAMNGGFVSGQTAPVSIQTSPTNIGNTTNGNVWVCYTTNGAGVVGGMGGCTPVGGVGSAQVYYTQIATLTAKAT